jgi:hypothetical protein
MTGEGADEPLDVDVARARLTHVAYRPRASSGTEDVSLASALGALAQGAMPVRKPMQYRGQWCKPGWYYFAGLGEHVSYESRFEASHLMLADFGGKARAVIPQPFRLHWRLGRMARRHAPDFLIWCQDGTGMVLDVKGTARASESRNALVFEVTRQACNQMGLEYVVARDIPATLLRNVQWLAGYKDPFLSPGVANALLAAVTEPITCDEAAFRAAVALRIIPPMVLPGLFHLCWTGALSIDLTEPFSTQTCVGPAGLYPRGQA